MPRSWIGRWTVAAAALLGCDGSGAAQDPGAGGCDTREETLDAAPDALEGFGASPSQQIESLSGPLTAPDGSVLDVQAGFPAHYHAEVGDRPATSTEFPCGFGSQITLPATVTISTPDGRLNEKFESDLVLKPDVYHPGISTASFLHELPAEAVHGDIRSTLTPGDALRFEGYIVSYGAQSSGWLITITRKGSGAVADQPFSFTFKRAP